MNDDIGGALFGVPIKTQLTTSISGAYNANAVSAQKRTSAATRNFRVVAISNGYLVYTTDGSILGESEVATYVPDLAKVGELVVAQMAAAEMDRV